MLPVQDVFSERDYRSSLRHPTAVFYRHLATTLVFGAMLGTSTQAWAIPSPDLVVNLTASAAQVLGMVSVLFGGLAYTSRQKHRPWMNQAHSAWRWSFLAVLTCFLLALAGNIYLYTSHTDEVNRRLHANLVRSSVENGKTVADASLKTLSFSAQLSHPNGLATDDLAQLLDSRSPVNLIDVREPEETEAGRIEDARHVRYPDLRHDPNALLSPGSNNVLLCYSGNRSSELCDELGRSGYACRFLIGGYEKWMAEGRPLESHQGGRRNELRELPDFRNQSTLLQTPDVMRMVEVDNAIFVDVRYPGDFQRGRLPHAINIPLRKLPSEEMWSRLRALPERPIIAPCYDKRSCFYASILGLRLDRLGRDFRGRYTVPHEYLVPRQDKEHVARWKAGQGDYTVLAMASAPLRSALEKLTELSGHLAGGVLLLVVVLRALFLPLTLKSERDQLVQTSLAPEIAALKRRLGDDAPRLSRAIMNVYRRAGLTPVRNLIGTLAQVMVFLVFFSVVSQMADDSTQGLLWIPSLGEPDPVHILPITVGVLLFGYLNMTATRRSGKFLALYALGAGLLAYLIDDINAGAGFYLVCSIGLVAIQSVLIRVLLKPACVPPARKPRKLPVVRSAWQHDSVVPLRCAHHADGAGNKAARLARLMEAGLPVPDGFCITSKLLERGEGSDKILLSPKEQRALSSLWRRLGAKRVAVRSSGLNEDGGTQSYAGVFESRLNVDWEGLLPSLLEVRASMGSHRAGAYSGNTQESGGVLVQRMVAAEYSGVLFTEHPASAGSILVEMVQGLGEALVSGSVTPEAYCFGYVSGLPLDGKRPPIELRPLLQLGTQVEDLFGRPQDIEWAYSRGRFVLLQARDITTSVREGHDLMNARERERHRLLKMACRAAAPHAVIYAQNELSELVPRPTPLSASFLERFWAPGGSTDKACRSLGIPYDVNEDSPPYVNTVFGALYVNQVEGRRRTRRGPGPLAAFRLARGAEPIEWGFREYFLPHFLSTVRIREAVDPENLSLSELLTLFMTWAETFVSTDYVQAEIINVAADIYWKTASRKLLSKGLDPADHLSTSTETVVHRAMSLLAEAREGRRPVDDFLELFGHRAPLDYEFRQPRYREDPELVARLLERSAAGPGTPSRTAALPRNPVLALAVKRAEEFQVLKEEAKHHCLRQFANLRRLLLALDERLSLEGGIFYLTLTEISRLQESDFRARAQALIARRREEETLWQKTVLPSRLSIQDLERMDTEFAVPETTGTPKTLRGTRVAGEGGVVGPVQVIHDPADIGAFREGHVLVARFTDPAWTPLFSPARGIITEVGGWLSHAAIVAREYKVTAIVGVTGCAQVLETGQLVCLHADGTVEPVENQRAGERFPVSLKITLVGLGLGQHTAARLTDISRTGALVETDEDLTPGQSLTVPIPEAGTEIHVQIVRRDMAGGYGVRFTRHISDQQVGLIRNDTPT